MFGQNHLKRTGSIIFIIVYFALSIVASALPELPSTRPWTADNAGSTLLEAATLEHIEAAFNAARVWEGEVLADHPEAGYLPVPPMNLSAAFTLDEWHALSSSEKAFWLINDARTARGLPPFEGIDPALENVGLTYIQFLVGNNLSGHIADGSNPPQRMIDDWDVGVQCVEFPVVGETLSYLQGFNNQTFASVPIAIAVYNWLYISNNHRRHILSDDFNWDDNSGEMGKEGLMSVAFLQFEGDSYDPSTLSLDYSGGVQIAIFDYYDPLPDCPNVPAGSADPLAVAHVETAALPTDTQSTITVLFAFMLLCGTCYKLPTRR